jgi:hypothetical protein
MVKKFHIKPNSKMAIILKKIVSDKVFISEHLNNGGKLSDLHGQIGIKSTNCL